MPWRSWISAVLMIVVIAVAAFLRTFETTAQCLTYVNSFVNSFVNLMEYEFVLMWVGDILCRFCYQIGFIVFNMVNDVVPEVYARLFAPANAVIEMDTAVPEVEVLTAPVATAPPPRANAGVAPNTAPPPALTEQAAVDPLVAFAYALAAGDAIENIEVLPLRSPRGPVVTAQLGFPAVNNLAVRTPAVQPNNTKTARERLAEHREKRRLEGAAHQQR